MKQEKIQSNEVEPKPVQLSPESYDADTPSFTDGVGKRPLRISGIDGTEINSGRNAEYFKKGLIGIFGGAEAKVISDKQDMFGRDLGNAEVDGVNWKHLLLEVGVSENWGKYGFDDLGSEEDERVKWYSGKTQSTNIEAYELLASNIEPSEIISDQEFQRINALKASVKTHLNDANGGVLDKEDALATVKELMQYDTKLALAQKRRWYELARKSNIAETMLMAWNDPYTRGELESNQRTRTMDVGVREDTSYTALAWNSVKQQFGVGENFTRSDSKYRDRFGRSTIEDVNEYIQDNDLSVDEAEELYKTYNEQDGSKNKVRSSTQELDKKLLDIETKAQANEIEKLNGLSYGVKMLVNEALPYVVDPATYLVGAGALKASSKVTFSKVSSPLVRNMLQKTTQGAAVGLSDSMVYTTRNYKDFTNEELVKTWGMDTAMGAAFGTLFGLGETVVKRYGQNAKLKASSEGLDDLDITFTPKTQKQIDIDAQVKAEEDAMFAIREQEDKAFQDAADEMQLAHNKMQDELYADLLEPETYLPTTQIDEVELTPAPPKVEIVEEVVEETAESSGKPTNKPVKITPEEQWQTDSINAALEHQQNVVRPKLEEVMAGTNVLAKIHRWLGKGIGLQDFATRMLTNKDNKMSFIGSNILEVGAGFIGKVQRKASAALIKDSIYTRNVGNLNKAYVDNIRSWALSRGEGTYSSWKAAYEGGRVNKVAQDFHKAVFRHQEVLQAGKTPDADEFIQKYVKQLNEINAEMFQARIDANIKGFDANRKIGNYIPHVWKKIKVAEVVKRYGEDTVLDLLVDSIESAKKGGKIADDTPTIDLAKRQLNWINGLGDAMEHVDEVGAGVSGRGKSRIPLDFTVERNGLSMLDLIDTDLPTVMDSYIQRAGADIGISKATNGMIRSEGDFDKFLTPDSDADKLLVQDAKDMLYGRPTRGGMSPEMRNLMDLVTVQQMGGLGMAQLAETGTMAQKLVVNYISQPKIAAKMWKMAGEDINDKGVLHQIRSISAINDNMEYIHRFSVNNIDQAQIEELSDLRAASIDAVDKGTLGAYKAQFGRMLGKISGVNAVQKAQSRLLQASFSVDLARQAKFGKGTTTVARRTDLGITEDGIVMESIRKHVEFDEDGFPTNFNFEKWDKEAVETFSFAMNREEAQLMPRIMSGELPVFMNKPLWQAIMQFRKTPLTFMSKGAQRSMQFADREAAVGTVLNAMTAGITRYAKFAAAGGIYVALTDEEFTNPSVKQMQPWNYVSNFGILGDAYTIGDSWSKAAQSPTGIEAFWEGAQQVPILSSLDNAYNAVQGDPAAVKAVTPLNTLPLVNELSNAVVKNIEQEK